MPYGFMHQRPSSPRGQTDLPPVACRGLDLGRKPRAKTPSMAPEIRRREPSWASAEWLHGTVHEASGRQTST